MADNDAFERVAALAELVDGGLLAIARATGERVCLVRRGDTVTAVSDVCPHQDFSIALGDLLPDGTIQCAWHGARFDCVTGETRQGPATRPLPVYAVRIESGQVLVGSVVPRLGPGYQECVARAEAT